jgi:hypothetical protein
MKWVIVALLVIHGAIHSMGFLKAYGIAELPQLRQPISPAMGRLWLAAAVLVLVTAACLAFAPRVGCKCDHVVDNPHWLVGGEPRWQNQAQTRLRIRCQRNKQLAGGKSARMHGHSEAP